MIKESQIATETFSFSPISRLIGAKIEKTRSVMESEGRWMANKSNSGTEENLTPLKSLFMASVLSTVKVFSFFLRFLDLKAHGKPFVRFMYR